MIKLERFKLSEGMVLAEPVFCKKTGKMLLNYGTVLTESHIASLKERNIKIVSIVERYTLLIEPSSTILKELKRKITLEILRLAPEKEEANTSDFMVEVSARARNIVGKIMESSEIIEFCIRMKLIDDDFLLRHGIETCALCLLVAGAMGLNDEEMFYVGAAALLHDIGLCELPLLIKESQRSPAQESSWQEHCRYGYYCVKESGLPKEISKYILFHHEQWNGEGFPERLSGESIPLGSRIIAVCEQYNGLLLQGNTHYQAIEYLYGGGGYYFDSKVVRAFTNYLAVYPLGSMVRLSTGEVGVVINVRKNLGPRPIVRIYYNRVNRPLSIPKDIDLSQERTIFIEQIL